LHGYESLPVTVMSESIEYKIEHIKEFSKQHTPFLMAGMYVCHGVYCEDCVLSKSCKVPINIEPHEIVKIKEALPEHFL